MTSMSGSFVKFHDRSPASTKKDNVTLSSDPTCMQNRSPPLSCVRLQPRNLRVLQVTSPAIRGNPLDRWTILAGQNYTAVLRKDQGHEKSSLTDRVLGFRNRFGLKLHIPRDHIHPRRYFVRSVLINFGQPKRLAIKLGENGCALSIDTFDHPLNVRENLINIVLGTNIACGGDQLLGLLKA